MCFDSEKASNFKAKYEWKLEDYITKSKVKLRILNTNEFTHKLKDW
jgi:hypothetical protein